MKATIISTGNMASHTSHERSCRFIIAIRPTMPAASPNDSAANACHRGTSTIQGVNTVELMMKKAANIANNATDHRPSFVDGVDIPNTSLPLREYIRCDCGRTRAIKHTPRLSASQPQRRFTLMCRRSQTRVVAAQRSLSAATEGRRGEGFVLPPDTGD